MDAVVGAVEPISTHQYEMVYALIRENLTAQELTFMWPFRNWVQYSSNPTFAMANRLRPLIKRGWIEKLPNDPASLIYTATQRAREAVCW